MSNPSTNEPSLYAAREPIFPRRVKGAFRTLKWWLMAVLLGIYYITPWIRWDRGPNLPDQAVLIDMANRRFFFFMIEIWPHEFYFVAGLLIMAGLGLFLFTSAAARKPFGPTCSFWSNAGLRATATPAFACIVKSGIWKRFASVWPNGRSGLPLPWPPAALGCSISPMHRRCSGT